MGILLSRWRKAQSTVEILEQLTKDIERLESVKRTNLAKQKRIIGALLLYSVFIYILTAIIFYFLYFPEKWLDRLKYSSPLLLFPGLVWLLKRFLHWYFVKRITGNDDELESLKEKKKKILEDVMEKEIYKKAKEILEKFDPERFKKLDIPDTPADKDGQELRQRKLVTAASTPVSSTATPPTTPVTTPVRSVRRPTNTPGVRTQTGVRLPLPRPVLPQERSTLDKLVEYLVGDGPQNRYALICSNCSSHNGMALKEEFEFIAFRCCYCFTPNPARKKRPFAPPLQSPRPPPHGEDVNLQESSEDENHMKNGKAVVEASVPTETKYKSQPVDDKYERVKTEQSED